MAGIKWYNKDGLTVRFGPRAVNEDEDVASQTSTMGKVQELTLKLKDLSTLPLTDATGVAAGEFVNSARVPAGASILSAKIVGVTDAVGATANLNVGAYTLDAATGQLSLTGGDADGFINDTDGDVAGILDGAVVTGTGALINAEVGAVDIYVAASYTTAAFTAGACDIVIEYLVA